MSESKAAPLVGVEELTRPLEVREVSLDVSHARVAPARELPDRVRLPEPMLRYACNQQGCCCSGWRIPFRSTDLVRLKTKLRPEDLDKLTRDVEFQVRTDAFGDPVVDEFQLKDEDGLCRFLATDKKRCDLHARYGPEAMPDLCIDFPVATFREEDAETFFFDPVCPSVLDQIAESDAPISLVEVDPKSHDETFQHRARRSRGFVDLHVGGEPVGQDRVEEIRSAVLAYLADGSTPLWTQLHAVEAAFARVRAGEPFRLESPTDERRFMQHLGACLGAHGLVAMETNLRAYRRFVFALDLRDEAFRWDELGQHLQRWGEAYETFVGPAEEALAPLLRRYVAYCHATPYATPDGEFSRFAGVVTHKLCTALRYAAAIGACRGEVVDRDSMKVALGASEYFYRSRSIPPELMPWFEIG